MDLLIVSGPEREGLCAALPAIQDKGLLVSAHNTVLLTPLSGRARRCCASSVQEWIPVFQPE